LQQEWYENTAECATPIEAEFKKKHLRKVAKPHPPNYVALHPLVSY